MSQDMFNLMVAKLEALDRVANKKGAFEIHVMRQTIKNILAATSPGDARRLALEYEQKYTDTLDPMNATDRQYLAKMTGDQGLPDPSLEPTGSTIRPMYPEDRDAVLGDQSKCAQCSNALEDDPGDTHFVQQESESLDDGRP